MNKYLKLQKAALVLSMIIVIVMLNSCATLLSGTKQEVYVNTEPQGAKILVNGMDQGVLTPATLIVKRQKQSVYTFQKQGYEDGTVAQYGSFNTVSLVNILIGGIIGIIIDASSGAMWEYSNPNVFYRFNSLPYTPTEQTILKDKEKDRVLLDNSDDTSLNHTAIRWNFNSEPENARIFWRVISNTPDQVNSTVERYLNTTPYEEMRLLNIPGLTYENSGDVTIEIKIVKTGYHTKIKQYNVRQIIDEKEISDFFELEKNANE